MIGFEQLNDMQQKAVLQTEGPLLILAGAGSGKTGALTVRMAHLLETGVKPWNILAITFTNKAAREMANALTHLPGMARQMYGSARSTQPVCGYFAGKYIIWIMTTSFPFTIPTTRKKSCGKLSNA